MKSFKLIILTFVCILSFILAKNRNRKLRNRGSLKDDQVVTPKTMDSMNTKPVHISEMMVGNPNNMVKDRSPMWKDFKDNRFERPFMHGVVGPQWNVPVAEDNKGFDIISSPMPKPNMATRVIANELPAKTYSPTAFDMPLRKDVIQTQIPASVTRTIETSSDPRFPPKKPVARVSGTLYHGTGSTDAKVIHGFEPSFLEARSKNKKHRREHKYHIATSDKKKIDCRNKNFVQKDTQKFREEGLKHAKKAFDSSNAVLGSISLPTSHMVLDVKTTNKRELPDFPMYDNNSHRQKRINDLRKTPAGVRAAHTPRRFS